MYYAATNSYASATSVGFANTWSAIGFATRQMRDAYVARATDLATKSILASELRKYGKTSASVDYFDAEGAFHQCIAHGDFFRTGYTIDPVTAEMLTDGTWTHG